MMVLDLMDLVSHATGGATPPVSRFWSAAFMPVMIFFGAVYRFYANEIRARKNGDISYVQILIGVASFAVSCVLFGVVMWAILEPLQTEKCADGASVNGSSTCPITVQELKYDAEAVMILTWVWIGYPIVSLVSRLMMSAKGYGENDGHVATGWISFFKDLSYAILDVVSKGGMALYVAYRTTWV